MRNILPSTALDPNIDCKQNVIKELRLYILMLMIIIDKETFKDILTTFEKVKNRKKVFYFVIFTL